MNAPHTCHALRCEQFVQPRMLFCKGHWAMLPKALQTAIWHSYRRGQEKDKRPSRVYLIVQAMAVATVGLECNLLNVDEADEYVMSRVNRLIAPGREKYFALDEEERRALLGPTTFFRDRLKEAREEKP